MLLAPIALIHRYPGPMRAFPFGPFGVERPDEPIELGGPHLTRGNFDFVLHALLIFEFKVEWKKLQPCVLGVTE
jgi:hypothetical protein